MAYRFGLDDATVEAGFRRIAGEQLGAAVAALGDEGALHAGVHDARKRIKKLRGLIRLVRPVFPPHAAENAGLRDAARTLSGLRDHAAMIEALDRLAAAHPERIDWDAARPLRRHLEARRDEAAGANDLPARIEAFRNVLREAGERATGWRLKHGGWAALEPGFARSYAQGQIAMETARRTGQGEDFHSFRKRVKDHGYHIRLLAPIWPALLDPYSVLLYDLGEVLGENNDLVTLAPLVAASDIDPCVRRRLDALIAEERRRLESQAFVTGARVYAERPRALARRIGAWWAAWEADPAAVDQDETKAPPRAESISAMLSAIP